MGARNLLTIIGSNFRLNFKQTLFPAILLLFVIPLIYGTTNLDSVKSADCLERMVALIGLPMFVPLLKPAVASATILVMQTSWNELVFSLQLTNLKTYPLTVGVARYVGAVSVDWGKCSAAAAITMVPIIIVGFAMQKYLVSGMTAGAVKG